MLRRFIVSAVMALLLALCLPAASFASNDLDIQGEAAFSAWDIADVLAVESVGTTVESASYEIIATSYADDVDEHNRTLEATADSRAEPQTAIFVGGYNVLKMPARTFAKS